MRRQGTDAEEAKDLTQGFFALLLERRDLDTVRKEKGRLRSYLLTSLKHFLTNERNRAMAIKRGEGQRLISLDQLYQGERAGFEPADTGMPTRFTNAVGRCQYPQEFLARREEEYGVLRQDAVV